MATRVLLHLNDATHRCVFSCDLYRTKFTVQNIIDPSRYLRGIKKAPRVNRNQSSWIQYHRGSSGSGKLFKSFLFASGFSTATFLGATIWEYERIRSQTYKRLQPYRSQSGIFADLKRQWKFIPDYQKVVGVIVTLNALVFLAWRIPSLQRTMALYFSNNPMHNFGYAPMVLSMFSHQTFLHLAANMFVLFSFSASTINYLGKEHFVALYLSSGVFANFASDLCKIIKNRPGFSLGASGAILGIVGFSCWQFPDHRLALIFLPFFTFSAQTGLAGIMAFDMLGVLLNWQIFDHAAHLGGALFGMFWQMYGIEHIWRKRGPVLEKWHKIRGQ